MVPKHETWTDGRCDCLPDLGSVGGGGGEERRGREGGGGMKTGLKQDWWLLMPLVGYGVGRLEGGGGGVMA